MFQQGFVELPELHIVQRCRLDTYSGVDLTSALSVLRSNPQQLDTSHRTRRRENSRSGIKWKSADIETH
jgi:hypothetical protein